ncbi:MAG: redox-regulated ATPase YchF [Fastidiosipilaceae bacterium]|jgi:GTP-binding protein YchF|nr:redox-regulated ATPase YchF [Clostridiaceae bacterium]
MKLGIVGLPNVGKSTLFNAITQAGAECANYPYCTIEPNVGTVAVPDERLTVLAEMYQPRKVLPAVIEFVDIAGLIAGASKGEGLGNQFLANIREVDAIVHVVRCFEDENVIHVAGKADAARDIDTINLELIFSDIEYLERRIEKTKKAAKSGDKTLLAEVKFYEKIMGVLEAGRSARTVEIDDSERQFTKELNLLSAKPVLYVANISDSDIGNDENNVHVKQVADIAASEEAEWVSVSAEIEEEIAALEEDERADFLEDLGLAESGLDKIIAAGYRLLGLISFLTVGEDEVRAWTITKGLKAPQAAGKIHSDFQRGFIRAEVITYDDLIAAGSMVAAKEKGLVRSEGKEYVMQDGDVVLFRFNV